MTSTLSPAAAAENRTFESIYDTPARTGAPMAAPRADHQFAGRPGSCEELAKRRLKAMADFTGQFEILKRIATFSAGVRGHELGDWHESENGAKTSCRQCGAELRVYYPALQPEMDGPALDRLCGERPAVEQAA